MAAACILMTTCSITTTGVVVTVKTGSPSRATGAHLAVTKARTQTTGPVALRALKQQLR